MDMDLIKNQLFFLKYNNREKFYHRCACVHVKCENQMLRIFFISFHTLACRSEIMTSGSSSIIAQSLKTLQQNGPELKNISNNGKYMF